MYFKPLTTLPRKLFFRANRTFFCFIYVIQCYIEKFKSTVEKGARYGDGRVVLSVQNKSWVEYSTIQWGRWYKQEHHIWGISWGGLIIWALGHMASRVPHLTVLLNVTKFKDSL